LVELSTARKRGIVATFAMVREAAVVFRRDELTKAEEKDAT
jgi:hypothetical protein